MRKLIILIFFLQLILNSCESNGQNSTRQENVLLAKDVSISSLVDIENEKNPEWTKSLDRATLIDTVFKNVMAEKTLVYQISPIAFEEIEHQTVMPPNDLADKMGSTINYDGIICSEIKEILFYEKWFFDNKKLKLFKEILVWCPVRTWKANDKEGKKKIFYAYPKDGVIGKKIATSIISEIPWSFEFPTSNVGFDKFGFLTFLIEEIKSGKIDAYDPIYLVDKSKRKFSLEKLIKYIGQDLNPGLIDSYLNSMLFEEDWYFDETTLSIQKDVKSFAFVQEKPDSVSGEWSRKYCFSSFQKNKKNKPVSFCPALLFAIKINF